MRTRPKHHFTPVKGWMNDPNGTIYIDGTYHLFYQYYPDDIVWGPMHWGHAISKDLIHWNHEDIALYPDKDGYIFSGSCVLDKDNVSGFGRNGIKPLIAIYTCHNPGTGYQQQCIAYSLDYIHFTKYEGNPVICNTRETRGEEYEVDFRDPKVFCNPVKGGYSMVLAVGRIIEFYHSYNLIDWARTGSFDPACNGYYGICECPDCFPLKCEDEEKWILSISSILEDDRVGKPVNERGFNTARVMQYFVGEFDGDTFIDTMKCDTPLILDYGTDNYAMVTFNGTDSQVAIGWGEHWDYAMKTPVTSIDSSDSSDSFDSFDGLDGFYANNSMARDNCIYRGKMTLARTLSLVSTPLGYRVWQIPYNAEEVKTTRIHFSAMDIDNNMATKVFYNEDRTKEMLKVTVSNDKIMVQRSSFMKEDNYNNFLAQRVLTGATDIVVYEDQGYYEIFADAGLIAFSVMTYE